MAKTSDTVRYTIDNSFIRDAFGNIDKSTLKDFDAQVKFITKALQSATNDIVRVTKTIDEVSGLAVATYDVKKSNQNALPTIVSASSQLEGKYAYTPDFISSLKTQDMRTLEYYRTLKGKEAQKEAKEALASVGGEAVLDPTHKNKERMSISYPVPESEYQKQLQALGSEKAVKAYFSKEVTSVLKGASSKSSFEQKERDIKEEQTESRKKERSETSHKTKLFATITAVITVLTAIADITRRILTAALTKASEVKSQAVEAKSIGISQEHARQYASQERAMGLEEGTIISAFKEIQDAIGDISNANEQTIGELAKVLQGETQKLLEAGLGRSDPEQATALILKDYFTRGQQGINSLGMQVGQYQAQRELATALEKAGLGQVANILRNMFYTNDTGIYRGKIGTATPFTDYMGLITAYTMGLTTVDNRQVAELGQVIDQLKDKFILLKENLEKGLLISLESLINKVNAWDIGKSATEKEADTRKNIENNTQVIQAMSVKMATAQEAYESNFAKAGIDFSQLGFESADAYLDFTKTKEGKYWSPKTAEQQTEFNKLIDFLKTDEGMETLYLIQSKEVAQRRMGEAQKDIEEGYKKGKTIFNASRYTEASLQAEAKRGITGTWFSDDYSAVNLLYKIRGNNAYSAFYDGGSIYEEVKNTYFKGNDITYADALKSGDAKNLTNELYGKASAVYKEKYPKQWKKLKGLSKEDLVKQALEDKTLSEFDVRDILKANVMQTGYGVSLGAWSVAKDALVQRGLENFQFGAGASSVLSQAMSTQKAKDFMTKSVGGVTATVSGYDEKTGNVTVTLVSKEDEKVREILSFRTDAMLGKKESYEFDLASQTDKARIMSSSQ